MKKTQNIILIMADQLAAHALSLYGNTVCKTPNLDRLGWLQAHMIWHLLCAVATLSFFNFYRNETTR